MKLTKINFIFENCDCLEVDGKYIGHFLVDNIKTTIQRIAINSIKELNIADLFVIEIHKNANKERYQFDIVDFKRKQMAFDRLASSDITKIVFEIETQYNNGTSESKKYNYYVNWSGESDYYNESQKAYLSELGNLYIVISKDKTIEDFFNKEDLNNKEYCDFHFNMLCHDMFESREDVNE